MADIPLFNLDADGRWRLAYNLQWIVQRRESSGRTEGVAFVATYKRIFLEVICEKGVPLTPQAVDRLEALPDNFREFAARPKFSRAQARKTVEGARTPEKPANAPAPALESVDRAA